MIPSQRMGMPKSCVYCGVPAFIRCCVCKTPYCSRMCQEEHWQFHFNICRPVPEAEPIYRNPPLLRRPLPKPNPLRSDTLMSLGTSAGDAHPETNAVALANPPNIEVQPPVTSSISSQLFSQLDLVEVGEEIKCQINLSNDGLLGFDAIFIEELTLSRVGCKMPEYCEQELKRGKKLDLQKIMIGDLVIAYIENDKDKFQRACVVSFDAQNIDLLLIDYARQLNVSRSNAVLLPEIPMLKKYRSLGLWFEATQRLENLISISELSSGKLTLRIDAKNLSSLGRTDYAKVTVLSTTVSREFLIHPWYKRHPNTADMILPDHKYRKIVPQALSTDKLAIELETVHLEKADVHCKSQPLTKSQTDSVKPESQPSVKAHSASSNSSPKSTSTVVKVAVTPEVNTPTVVKVAKLPEISTEAKIGSVESAFVLPVPQKQPDPVQPTPKVVEKDFKFSDLCKLEIKAGDKLLIMEMGGSINEFVVCTCPNYNDIISKIASVLAEHDTSPLDKLPQMNSVLLCKWTGEDGDGQKYRARVTGFQDDKVQVNFIDFGNNSVEPLSSLYRLPNILATKDFPIMVQSVKLSNVPDVIVTTLGEAKTSKFLEVVQSMIADPPSVTGLDGNGITLTSSSGVLINEAIKAIQDSIVPKGPLMLSDLGTTELKIGDSLCFTCMAETSNCINVFKVDDSDKLDFISNAIVSSPLVELLETPRVNQVVCCKWASEGGDNGLYRAVITATNPSLKRVAVKFIDYGNRAAEPLSSLYILPPSVGTSEYPCMAVSINLVGVPSIALNDNAQLLSKLESFLSNEIVMPFKVAAIDKTDSNLLFTVMSGDEKCVNTEMTKFINPPPKQGNMNAATFLAKSKGRA